MQDTTTEVDTPVDGIKTPEEDAPASERKAYMDALSVSLKANPLASEQQTEIDALIAEVDEYWNNMGGVAEEDVSVDEGNAEVRDVVAESRNAEANMQTEINALVADITDRDASMKAKVRCLQADVKTLMETLAKSDGCVDWLEKAHRDIVGENKALKEANVARLEDSLVVSPPRREHVYCAWTVCGETGILRCGNCRLHTLKYCSKACQKKHWSVHKTTCAGYEDRRVSS